MNPPTWIDEWGKPRPTQPCHVCGHEIAVLILPTDQLRWWGWMPFREWFMVEWCGHRVEGIPVPTEDGRWRLIPILGEAR